MTKKDKSEIQFEKPYKSDMSIGKMGYYIWFFTGLIIFIIGVFLTISDSISTGVTSANEIGEGGGRPAFINGPGAIGLGLAFLIALFFNRKNKTIR